MVAPYDVKRVARAVALATLLSTLTSCVLTSYRGVAAIDPQTPPLLNRNVAVFYHVKPINYWRETLYAAKADYFTAYPATPEDYEQLGQSFAGSGIFSSALPRLTAPEKGLYCLVRVEYVPVSDVEAAILSLSYATSGFLPFYHSSSGHIVRYDLYVDQELKKTYEYKIQTLEGGWLGLVPFGWVQGLRPGLGEAFRATTYQFFVDAALDGYMRPE